MRNIFKKDPNAKLVADVEHARKHRDRLAERFAKASARVEEEKHELARLLAADADDKAVGVVQASHRGALDTAEHVADALLVAEKHLSDLEKQLADLIDKAQRAETVAHIAAQAKELAAVKAEFDSICAKFSGITGRVGLHTYEARAIAAFMQQAPHEIAAGLAMVKSAMDGYLRMVEAGSAPAKISEPEAVPTPAPAAPKPEVAGLFAMKPIAWSEGGNVRLAQKGWPVALPASLADHAIQLRAALPPGHFDAAALSNRPARSRELPKLVDCTPLDDFAKEAREAAVRETAQPAPAEATQPEKPSATTIFQKIDRSPTQTGFAKVN